MNTYAIDLKVYEPAAESEVPFVLPAKLVSESRLRTGYHMNVIVQWSEEMRDAFIVWASKHGSILKVLGTTTIAA
jgi:hypothetical protein